MKIPRYLVLALLVIIGQLSSSTPEAVHAGNNREHGSRMSTHSSTAWEITFPSDTRQLQLCTDGKEGARLTTITLAPLDVYHVVMNASCQKLWEEQQERIERASETHGGGKIERLW